MKSQLISVLMFLSMTFAVMADVLVQKEGNQIKVTWIYLDPSAQNVQLIGDFNGWNKNKALPMKRNETGWTITLDARSNSIFLYKFIVDGTWTEDPTPPESVNDGFGQNNGKVNVKELLELQAREANPEGPAVVTLGYNPASFGYRLEGEDVVFIFSAKFYRPNDAILVDTKNEKIRTFDTLKLITKVALGGDFNGWKPTWIMKDMGDGSYQLRLPLSIFSEYPQWEFAFYLNNIKSGAPIDSKNKVPGNQTGISHLVFSLP